MSEREGAYSATGVWLSADFRSNLIIDRFDPVFANMRASKRKHLRSANSEDAVTWNVFRSLRQVAPAAWLPALFERSFSSMTPPACDVATVELWKTVVPPPSLLLSADEGESEIDVIIEAPTWVWFIEAKLGSDISLGTTMRKDRNQVLRNLDVGSFYAGVRPFYFSLLVADRARSAKGVEAVSDYTDLSRPRSLLAPHRPDGLPNLQAVSVLEWRDLGAVLSVAAAADVSPDQQAFAARALQWLTEKELA